MLLFYIAGIIWLLNLFFPLFYILHKQFGQSFILKTLFIISSYSLGIYFITFFIIVAYSIVSYFIWWIEYITLWIIILVNIYAIINGKLLYEKKIEIASAKVSKEYKFVYMSDIHIDGVDNYWYIQKLVKKLSNIKADFILINWDIVDDKSLNPEIFAELNTLSIPIYATLGNHEMYTGQEYCIKLLNKTNITLLQDSEISIGEISILWSDELLNSSATLQYKYDLTRLENFLKTSFNKDKFSILMVHEPVWVEISDKYGVDIQLAWHTHRGQLWPFTYLIRLAFKYVYGLYQVWKTTLYVGSWTGTWWPPMRLWSHNEIVIFTIKNPWKQ